MVRDSIVNSPPRLLAILTDSSLLLFRTIKHIAITTTTILIVVATQGQYVLDPCFGSINTGPDFSNSTNIANTQGNATDMVKFTDGSWTGVNTSVSNGLSIQPPVECDGSKAAFMRVISSDTIGQGIGFKLSSVLIPGTAVSFEMTYVSHGVGSTGQFQPIIYTSSNSNFLNDEGEIQALYAITAPQAGTEWTTFNVSWNVSGAVSSHNWIWVYAPESSGLLFNMCQMDVGPIDYGIPETEHICEGEDVQIGEDLGEGVNYTWTGGGSEPFINVASTGVFNVVASNFCNSTSSSFPVVVHGPPELVPPVDELLMCEGDSLELTTTGFNQVNSWPDGSFGESWWLADEGTFEISVTDECFTSEFTVTADFDTIPFIDLGPDFSLCEGQTSDLDGTVWGFEDVTYSWSTGFEEPIYTVVYEDTYSLTVENECGSYTDEIFVEYSLYPDSILPPEIELCLGRDHLFDVSHIDAAVVTWQDGTEGPTLLTEYTGPYVVEIVDDDYCWIAIDTVMVVEGGCECPFYMPNAFTPDWDGLNDWFKPVFECAPYDYVFEVYDRWGVVVHRDRDPKTGWDGRIHGQWAKQETYHWRVWYREEFHGIPIEKFGSVTVIGHKLEP